MLENKIYETSNLLKKIIQDDLFIKKFMAYENEIIIESPNEAEIFATDQDVDINKGCDYQYWTMILEDEARTDEIIDYLTAMNFYDVLTLIDANYYDLIENFLEKEYYKLHSNSALYDVLCGELYNVFVTNIIFTDQNLLHRKMMNSFMRGGMICGWKGRYPDGQALIFPLN
ncbi:hypothetical protein F993_01952 [Acinetobacter proteolyticus]|uniref:DUF4240 domain-containing protein n=1 Tax=Acinetobacter proteolyticus TaxID=1776741 RepID=A0ABN0JEX7_9GAMM|nr:MULTISPECIES: hypothetical protein [Acinetobacter]ENU23798.1 hypothetical protein F993_01952 [Acinetobacter proteolyticus]MCH7296926.1 hypothetical protein [Acinetobacter higginsii]